VADLPFHPDTDDETGGGTERSATSGRPRWKSVAVATIAVAVLALFVVLHLTGVLGPADH
jgi:anti-sigma-K factor RskA